MVSFSLTKKFQDYMEVTHGKEIDLQKTTVKIPGANKPRIGKSVINLDANKLNNEINSLHINTQGSSAGATPSYTSASASASTLSDFKVLYSDDLNNMHHFTQQGY
jgi:hypothetical protein